MRLLRERPYGTFYSCLVQFVLKGHRPTHGDNVSINTQHRIGRDVCTHTIGRDPWPLIIAY